MAYVISDDCVSCGSCAAVCPADAISEGDGKYVIDADACLDCGTCEAECPNEALHPGESSPVSWIEAASDAWQFSFPYRLVFSRHQAVFYFLSTVQRASRRK